LNQDQEQEKREKLTAVHTKLLSFADTDLDKVGDFEHFYQSVQNLSFDEIVFKILTEYVREGTESRWEVLEKSEKIEFSSEALTMFGENNRAKIEEYMKIIFSYLELPMVQDPFDKDHSKRLVWEASFKNHFAPELSASIGRVTNNHVFTVNAVTGPIGFVGYVDMLTRQDPSNNLYDPKISNFLSKLGEIKAYMQTMIGLGTSQADAWSHASMDEKTKRAKELKQKMRSFLNNNNLLSSD